MSAETDKFIVATYALWAGDFVYAERLLTECAEFAATEGQQRTVDSAEQLMWRTAGTRLRQLRQRKGEFKKFAAEYEDPRRGVSLVGEPLVITTSHMHATVWRVTEREFHVQAYLTDLSWEKGLFTRALRARDEHGESARREADTTGREPFGARFVAGWTIVGPPFLQVEVIDLGLVEVMMLWTQPALPASASELSRPLVQLLERLDPPNAQPEL